MTKIEIAPINRVAVTASVVCVAAGAAVSAILRQSSQEPWLAFVSCSRSKWFSNGKKWRSCASGSTSDCAVPDCFSSCLYTKRSVQMWTSASGSPRFPRSPR